ncbi:MAG: diguanylate cyclase [Proteobacteria bacterium]|jgi:diguanylate cyclase (GGDEF)-like protein|nr:diguanylate cyclase [Pseudomonadota bacterium]
MPTMGTTADQLQDIAHSAAELTDTPFTLLLVLDETTGLFRFRAIGGSNNTNRQLAFAIKDRTADQFRPGQRPSVNPWVKGLFTDKSQKIGDFATVAANVITDKTIAICQDALQADEIAIFPIVTDDTIVALLSFISQQKVAPHDLPKMQAFASQVQLVFENARLAKRAKATTVALQRRESTIHSLNSAASELHRAQTPQGVYEAVATELCKHNINTAITLYDCQSNKIRAAYTSFATHTLEALEKIAGIRVDQLEFPLTAVKAYEEAKTTGNTVLYKNLGDSINKILGNPMGPLASEIMGLAGMKSSIAAPLIVKGELFGFVDLSATGLTEEDIPTVTAFAHHISSALANTQLFTELHTKAENELQNAKKLQKANRRLTELVRYDSLTGLLNRRGIEERLAMELQRVKRLGHGLGALLVDLDDFKAVNDVYGYSVGDEMLHRVGQELGKTLRNPDHIARIGGDEFLLLLPDTRRAEGMVVSERVREAIARIRLHNEGNNIRVTASMGLVGIPPKVHTINEILQIIHPAIRASKGVGKNRVTITDGQVVHAEAAGLWAVSQAIYDLSSERPIGYEFLIRGQTGEYALPAALFQLSLQRKPLGYLDMLCFRTCAAAARIHSASVAHLNMFPSTVQSAAPQDLIDILCHESSDTEWCIEISEQLLVGDPGTLQKPISKLKAAGIKIAIDDAGCGRSSLEALIVLQPDILKIDPRLVTAVAKDHSRTNALVRLVRIGEALGTKLIAEGIESQADLELLQEIGVGLGQGFLWGQPTAPN